MIWKRPGLRLVIIGGFLLLSCGWTLTVRSQTTTISGHVYEGLPPQTQNPVATATVSLYGDDDASPDNGSLTLLAQTATEPSGAFTLSWTLLRISYACLHVRVEVPTGTTPTAAESPLPGTAVDRRTIALLDVPAGVYSGLAFWIRRTTAPVGPLPDLLFTSVDLDPRTPDSGEPVALHVAIANQGRSQAGGFSVQFLVDGTPLSATLTIGGLSAGGSASVGTHAPGFDPGFHIVEGIIDPDDRVEESDETNNRFLLRLDIPDSGPSQTFTGPDLTIAEADLTPRIAPPNTARTLTCTVANLGNTAAGATRVAVLDPRLTPLGTIPVPAILPGNEATLSLLVRPPLLGEGYLQLLVDPQNAIAETDERNNSIALGIWGAYAPQPDLAIISVTAEAWSPGLPHVLTVRIENQGTSPAGTFAVTLDADGVQACAPAIVDALGVDASVDVRLFVTSSDRLLTAFADSANWIIESNEFNNRMPWIPASFLLPDLAVESLAVSADPLHPDVVSLSITVANRGAETAWKPHLLLAAVDRLTLSQAPGSPETSWLGAFMLLDLPDLVSGESYVHSEVWTVGGRATNWSILAEIDPFALIKETDESNNAAEWPSGDSGGE